jgi:hypothetical protein
MTKFSLKARSVLLLATVLSGCHLVVDFDASRIGTDASTDSGSTTQDMGVIAVDGGDAEVDMGDVDMDVVDMGDVDMDVVDMGDVDMATADMDVPVDMATPDMCTPTTFYRDADEDGAGDPFVTMSACDAPSGFVSNDDDCNDSDDAIYGSATEVCDDKDNDCDLEVDEGVKTTFYPDADNDTFGNTSVPVEACTAPAQHVTVAGDCDDDNTDIKPGADDLCDGVDNDCSSDTVDGFGEPTFGDACDESDDGTCGGTIICGVEGLVCSEQPVGFCYIDGDEDGFGDSSTQFRSCACEDEGGALNGDDCDDVNDDIYPGAPDVCDGVQNDCNMSAVDGSGDPDLGQSCNNDNGTCSGIYECNSGILSCNAPDQTSYFTDADGDGYGSTMPFLSCSSSPPDGASSNSTDCDDTSDAANPGIVNEMGMCSDGLDNDCDGFTDIADDADCVP